MDDKDKKGEEVHEEIQRIRMTLRSKEVKPLEAACAEIVSRAKNQDYETKGPVRIPTKILRITCRKTPCGEGSKTWDRFEMRIHKRVIDIHCPSSVVKEITNFRIDPGVDVNLIRIQGQSDLVKLLPQVSDLERQSVREQILDTLSKSMNPSQVQHLMEQNNMGGGGTTVDRGEYSEMTALEISIQLETLIFAKYPDTSSPNYKALSKKVITSIKSKEDQRLQLLDMKEQSEIEDFLQNFMSSRGRGLAAQQQESSGSQATSGPPPSSQSNPFAFAQNRQPPPGMPPNQSRKPPAPQNRFPQNRFAAPTIFQQPPVQQETESSKMSGQQEQEQSSPHTEVKDMGKAELNVQENQNKVGEDIRVGQRQSQQQCNYAESGAADQSINLGEERKVEEQKIDFKQTQNKNSGLNQDDLDFFNQLAENAVKQHQTQAKSYGQQNKQQTQAQHQTQKPNERYSSDQQQTYIQQQQQHSINEEQSRGYSTSQDYQEQPDLRAQNQRSTQSVQEGNQNQRVMLQNQRQTQEGRIFDSRDNLEQEEGLQTQFQTNEPTQENLNEPSSSQQYDDYLQEQNIEDQQRAADVEETKNEYFQQVEQAQANSIDLQSKYFTETKKANEFDIPDPISHSSRNHSTYEKQKTSPPKELSMSINTQSLRDLHDAKRLTPSVKGFIPISASRPPQSVASVNITNLEDSEALIRAYKRKKLEAEELKQKFYDMETEFFTLKEKSKHLEEEKLQLKGSLQKTEKQLKDYQLKDQRNDRDLLQKQMQLKNQQVESYQKELQNQKGENQRLRERMKDMMNRSRSGTGKSMDSQSQDYSELVKERDHYMMLANQYKQDFDNLQNEFNDFKGVYHQQQRSEQEDSQIQIQQVKQQLSQQRNDYEAKLKAQIDQNKKLQQDIMRLEQQKKASPVVEVKSQGNDKRSEEETMSFENIQKESPHGQDEMIGFAGYYESKRSSDGSGGSNKQGEKQKTSNIQNNYFKNDENEKQSSAPPSQPKPQVRQPQNVQRAAPKNVQEEGNNFFDKLSSQGSQSSLPQQRQPQRQPPPQQNIQQQQALVQNRPPPQQFNQMQRPPPSRPPMPQNAYDFSLDDMSFEQTIPSQQYRQVPQYRQPPPRPVQQQQTRPQAPVMQIKPQQVQQMKAPVPSQYGFELEDTDTSKPAQPSQAPNVIPKSLFD